MNKTFNKALFALALVATTCISFAQAPAAPEGAMPPPPKMDKKACPHMGERGHAPFDEELAKLIKAYREDASEANLEALKAKLASDFDARLAKQQAKIDEMKANREQHLEKVLKCMTDPKATPKACEGKGPRPEGPCPKMDGKKGPRPEGPCPKMEGCRCKQGKMHGRKGPRPEMKGPRPEGREGHPRGPRPEMKGPRPEGPCPKMDGAPAPVAPAPVPAE